MHFLKTSMAAAAVMMISTIAQDWYYIVPDTVSIGERRSWCVTQRSSCPLLCLQNDGDSATTAANECDPETLTYQCVCGNGLTPNASEYTQTLPFFICRERGNQCVSGCGNGNTACQASCREDHPCGAQEPTRVNITTSSSATADPTSSATGGVVYNGFDAEPTQSSGASSSSSSSNTEGSKSGSAAAVELGRSYGLAVVFSGIFAGFALVL